MYVLFISWCWYKFCSRVGAVFWYYNPTGRITLRYLISMDIVCVFTPSFSLIFKLFVFKNFYYLELLLLDQTSEQLLIWYIGRGPRVDCGLWIFFVFVVVVTTVGSSSPIWRVKSITLVHVLHCSLGFQCTFFSYVQQGMAVCRSVQRTTENTVRGWRSCIRASLVQL